MRGFIVRSTDGRGMLTRPVRTPGLMDLFLIFVLTGAVAGVLAGLFGIGGGMIMVPALALILPTQDVPADIVMHVALGTSLAVIAATSISAAA